MPFCFHPHQSDHGHCLSQKWLHLDSEGFCSWEQGHQWSVHANPQGGAKRVRKSSCHCDSHQVRGSHSHTCPSTVCLTSRVTPPAFPGVLTQIWVSELKFLKEPYKNQRPRTFKNQNTAPSILTTSLSLKTGRRIPYMGHLPSKTNGLFAFG